jgi:exopolyphosphatase/pppGpp-phosphohydrolase
VIVGGSIILVEVMRHFALDHITVSERDILDGLAASLRAPSAKPA